MDILDINELYDGVWILRHGTGQVSSENIQFLHGGLIAGYSHPNEAWWRCENGFLEFLNEAGQVTSRFTDLERDSGALVRMTGQFLLQPELKLDFILERRDARRGRTLPGGMREEFTDNIREFGWEIGEHSYGKPLVYANFRETKLKVGRFCSVGHDVTIVLVNHHADFVTTYPFATHRDVWPETLLASDYTAKGDVVIGNDVWIGHGAFIGSGVNIGDGAIVGAQTVVTRNVPPYGIVVGSPARLIRYRFDPEIIGALLEIKWWNWPDDTIVKFLPALQANDIQAFIRAARLVERDPA